MIQNRIFTWRLQRATADWAKSKSGQPLPVTPPAVTSPRYLAWACLSGYIYQDIWPDIQTSDQDIWLKLWISNLSILSVYIISDFGYQDQISFWICCLDFRLGSSDQTRENWFFHEKKLEWILIKSRTRNLSLYARRNSFFQVGRSTTCDVLCSGFNSYQWQFH